MNKFKIINILAIAVCSLGVVIQVGGDYYAKGWADYGIYLVSLGLIVSSANQYSEDKKKKKLD